MVLALELDCLEGGESGGVNGVERREEREGVGKRKRGGIENQENSKRNQGKGEGGRL